MRTKTTMDTALKKLGLFSLLMMGATLAFAFPSVQLGAGAESQGGQQAPREERPAQRQTQLQQERRQQNEMRRSLPQSGDANARGDNGARDAQAQQKNSRLSAEERRALRRQINEAGQDIYSNKR